MAPGPQHAIRIGTAGWSIPRQHADHAATDGSHLERYARVFSCAEINSRFYRPHKPATWARWAAAVPASFRFAVKMPRAITHEAELACEHEMLQEFFTELRPLGEKLGPVLVQLPPSLEFFLERTEKFLMLLRRVHEGAIVLEPRHISWFSAQVDAMLREFRVARVAADPPKPAAIKEASVPGGWTGLIYYRLHGSPRVYYSTYEEEFLRKLAEKLSNSAPETWCIFDNTALGAAMGNAVELQRLLGISSAAGARNSR